MPAATELYEFTVPDLGTWLGHGAWRHVFVDPHDPQCVIKIARYNGTGGNHMGRSCENNLTEVQVWNTVKNTELEQWFAPVIDHDPEGHWIRSVRVTRSSSARGPSGSWQDGDMARSWGLWQQRPVIYDYGNRTAYTAVCKHLGIDTDA